jgi:hypothetical protein
VDGTCHVLAEDCPIANDPVFFPRSEYRASLVTAAVVMGKRAFSVVLLCRCDCVFADTGIEPPLAHGRMDIGGYDSL